MLVEVDRVAMWRRGKFGWFRSPPSYRLEIACGRDRSNSVSVRGQGVTRVGLVWETGEINGMRLPELVITFSKEVVRLPLVYGVTSLPVETAKYKGSVMVRLCELSCFGMYERDRVARTDLQPFSQEMTFDSGETRRRLYNGETYTVNLRTMETSGYAPILQNESVNLAHMAAKLEASEQSGQNLSSEEASYIRKVRRLRSSPYMFVSIFSYITLETPRDLIVETLYKVYADPRRRKHMQRKICINFVGEIGEDHGALRKEMFELAAARLVQDERICLVDGLFDLTSDADLAQHRQTEKSNLVLDVPDASFYAFMGFFLGYVVFQQVQVVTRFSPLFWKAVLQQEAGYDDITDASVRQSIDWMRANSVNEMEFVDQQGRAVTDKNKEKFIQEVISYETYGKKSGYVELTRAFHALVTNEVLDFTADELSRLVSGVAVVPVDYLMEMAIYKRCNANTREVVFFWNIMKEGTDEFRREVLQFITGSSAVQHVKEGASECIAIEKVNAEGFLPTAHACFRRLVLYTYPTQKDLYQKLVYAMRESGGFHFV
ncbi:hypothetical protein NEHOM01_0716 [Nematocida homosporus]|uniref:uncharacterized protein n=1 Tax=Nematocida homosporus TaxID=1912981 RepID=UPI00221E7A95|nr:uncharacterized protein NEHOM01_0716 [Nematocida homosporus]KAI5185258.1 hypothetical protein NEHOM01_0716 [Nematocida homosporus]